MQESTSGRIEYTEIAADGRSQAKTEIEFAMEDVHKLRRALRKGTIVEFSICTDNQTKATKAVHVSLSGF